MGKLSSRLDFQATRKRPCSVARGRASSTNRVASSTKLPRRWDGALVVKGDRCGTERRLRGTLHQSHLRPILSRHHGRDDRFPLRVRGASSIFGNTEPDTRQRSPCHPPCRMLISRPPMEWYAARTEDEADRLFLLRKAEEWTKLAKENELEVRASARCAA